MLVWLPLGLNCPIRLLLHEGMLGLLGMTPMAHDKLLVLVAPR